MAKVGTVRFLQDETAAHGVHDRPERRARLVLCTVQSVRQSEYYQAQNTGYRPEIVFVLTLASDYRGEPRLEYEQRVYEIIRTYETEEGGLEITAQRSDVRD